MIAFSIVTSNEFLYSKHNDESSFIATVFIIQYGKKESNC